MARLFLPLFLSSFAAIAAGQPPPAPPEATAPVPLILQNYKPVTPSG